MKTIDINLETTSLMELQKELNKPFDNIDLPQIEMILSFYNKPQLILRQPLTPNDILDLLGKSETEYKENLKWFFYDIDTDGLYKISNCVYRQNFEFNLPQWYLDCNGKVFFDDTEDSFKLQIV